MADYTAYFCGRWMPFQEVRIDPLDRGYLGREIGVPVVEEDLQPYDLYSAAEAFFTSTSPCVLPVTRVDRRVIGAGKPGPVVTRLLDAWSEIVGVDIVAQARHYAPQERLESPRGS